MAQGTRPDSPPALLLPLRPESRLVMKLAVRGICSVVDWLQLALGGAAALGKDEADALPALLLTSRQRWHTHSISGR